MKGEAPEVLVTNVTPLEASAFEQRLQVDLRIRNPNDFDLAVTGIDFRLDLNGNRLARGLGNKELVVPRLSDSVTSVETSTSTLQVVRQLLSSPAISHSLTTSQAYFIPRKAAFLSTTPGCCWNRVPCPVLPLPSEKRARDASLLSIKKPRNQVPQSFSLPNQIRFTIHGGVLHSRRSVRSRRKTYW